MAKEILGYIKLQIPAGSANPAPPVGPALGQKGLNIQDFCKQFNDATKDLEKVLRYQQSLLHIKIDLLILLLKNLRLLFISKKQQRLKKVVKLPVDLNLEKLRWRK